MSARVVMTHLHTDHAGGLHHFPYNEILVTRTELEFVSGLRGRLRGYVANKQWPAWFDPTLVELEPTPFGPFPQSLRLTEAGDVVLVPLPGHTPGQIGVLLQDGDHSIFRAGDSSYTQKLMLRGRVDGVGADEEAARLTHERIRDYAPRIPRSTWSRTTRTRPRGSPSGGSCIRSRQRWRHDHVRDRSAHRATVGDVFAYVSDPVNCEIEGALVGAPSISSRADLLLRDRLCVREHQHAVRVRLTRAGVDRAPDALVDVDRRLKPGEDHVVDVLCPLWVRTVRRAGDRRLR
jgi:hypothetical protein